METQYIQKIRVAAKHPDYHTATRAEKFDHFAVSVLLDIIEKGHGTEAFEVLANNFTEDMQQPLLSWIQQQRALIKEQETYYSHTILE